MNPETEITGEDSLAGKAIQCDLPTISGEFAVARHYILHGNFPQRLVVVQDPHNIETHIPDHLVQALE